MKLFSFVIFIFQDIGDFPGILLDEHDSRFGLYLPNSLDVHKYNLNFYPVFV